MKTVEARGENCPLPVIKTKRALKEIEKDGSVLVRVDNRIAVENLEKMSSELGCKFESKKIADEHYEVLIVKGTGSETIIPEQKITSNKVIVISSDKMGDGEDELGKSLLKAYIFALSEQEEKPDKIIFYNKGAFLTSESSDSIDDLKSLENEGVEIYTCGACLNYYNLSEKLKVGSTTNMYNIVKYTLDADSVFKP